MEYIRTTVAYLAPCFIMMSPIISYTDQALSMHRNKASGGFSLDIPLIMLVASFLRCASSLRRRFRRKANRSPQDRLLARRAIRYELADTVNSHGGHASTPAQDRPRPPTVAVNKGG